MFAVGWFAAATIALLTALALGGLTVWLRALRGARRV